MKTFFNLVRTLAAVCALSLAALGQGVTVTATLTDGQGIPQKTSYLHWQLWNCGNNVPQIIGQPYAMVAQQFDMRANPTTGVISGSVYGNDQIECGNVLSTQWIVTEFKSSGQAGGQPQYYCLTNGESFNPATTQVCQVVPPPPGYILLFGNPIQSQTLDQPLGTEMNFQGTMNFCSATVLCAGGEGAYSLEVNGVGLSGGDTVNFNNSLPAAGANGLNVIFQTSKSGSTDSVSAELIGDGNAGHFLDGQGVFAAPPGNGLPSNPQTGDTLRWNVNGDNAWDAVNYSNTRIVSVFFTAGSNDFGASGGKTTTPNATGGVAQVPATYTDDFGGNLFVNGTPSTNTLVGVDYEAGANLGDFGIGSFYKWSFRFAAGYTTSVRYWMGMGVYFIGGTGANGTALLGTTAYATDTPNKSTVGFRFSAGTDSTWQACAVTAGSSSGTQTCTSTGVTPDTNPHLFEMTTTGTVVTYYIDHVQVATVSTNVPSGLLGGNSAALMFWTGDNKNTSNNISGTHYYMTLSPK